MSDGKKDGDEHNQRMFVTDPAAAKAEVTELFGTLPKLTPEQIAQYEAEEAEHEKALAERKR